MFICQTFANITLLCRSQVLSLCVCDFSLCNFFKFFFFFFLHLSDGHVHSYYASSCGEAGKELPETSSCGLHRLCW